MMTNRVSIAAVRRPDAAGAAPGARGPGQAGFARALDEARRLQEARLSKHAAERIDGRGMRVSEEDLSKVSDAMRRIAEKGGTRSAVFCNGNVFITDSRNMAIVTAMRAGDGGRIFTGIDSAVFV